MPRGEGKCLETLDPIKGNTIILKNTGNRQFHENKALVNLVKQRLDNGDLLGLHGFYHLNYHEAPPETQRRHIQRGVKYLRKLFNRQPKYYVAPYGTRAKTVIQTARRLGLNTLNTRVTIDKITGLSDKKITCRAKNHRQLHHVAYHPYTFIDELALSKLDVYLRNLVKGCFYITTHQ